MITAGIKGIGPEARLKGQAKKGNSITTYLVMEEPKEIKERKSEPVLSCARSETKEKQTICKRSRNVLVASKISRRRNYAETPALGKKQ